MKSVCHAATLVILMSACGGAAVAPPQMRPDEVSLRPAAPPDTPLDVVIDAAAPVVVVAFVDELARVPEARNPVPGSDSFETARARYLILDGSYDYADGTVSFGNGDFSISVVRDRTGFQGRDLQGYAFTGLARQELGRDLLNPDDDNRRIGTAAIFGVMTDPRDMPVQSTAQFVGDAMLTFTNSAGSTSYRSDAVIDADFNRARVRVTIIPEDGSVISTPFDRFERRNMVIRGSTFQGGYARYLLNNRVVTPMEEGAASFARGTFFGPVDEVPAEVGGMISIDADNASVTATFMAR